MIAENVRSTTMGQLMRLMGLGGAPYTLEAVCKTSDGMYLGQLVGDVGYNAFIGQPAKPHAGPGLDLTRKVWGELDTADKRAVLALAARPGDGAPIDLAVEFGVPVGDPGRVEV